MRRKIMRKNILTVGLAAILTGVLATGTVAYAADDELSQIQESGVLKVGVEGTYPPYTYHDEDGELTGFDDERSEKYDFAGPYFYITQQIVVSKDNDDIVDMDSLNGKKMANTATTAYLDLLEDAGASLVQINTADEAVSLISSGRADFTTFNSVVFNEYLQQHPDANLKVAFVIPNVVDEYGVPVKKGETALYDAIQSAIDELKEDGTLSQLSMDYFDTDFTQEADSADDTAGSDNEAADSTDAE